MAFNLQQIYQSVACINEAEIDLSIGGMYIRSRDRSIAYLLTVRAKLELHSRADLTYRQVYLEREEEDTA